MDVMDQTKRDGCFLQTTPFHVLYPWKTGEKNTLLQITGDVWVWQDIKREIVIPKKFIWDSASIPNKAYALLDSQSISLIVPSGFHDYLYREDAVMRNRDGSVREYDREEADQVLSKICDYCGCDWSDRQLIYYGVRVGGSFSYAKKSVAWLMVS